MFISQIKREDLTQLKTTSVLLSQAWIKIMEDDRFVLNGIFNKNKELIGCFYYTRFKRGKVFSQISASPFTPHCGLFVKDETINPSQKNTFEKKIMQLIAEYFNEKKVDILALPFPCQYSDMQSFIWEGYSVEPRYTYQLNLAKPEEELLAGMSPERRKNIRKAQKDGINIQKENDYSAAKELIEATYKNQGLSIDKNVFDAIFTSFSTERNTICMVSHNKKGDPIACVYCIFDQEICYYIMGGYSKTSRHEGAGALAMWEAIKIAKEKGIRTFDFEGSMLKSVEKYFRGFGGEIKPFYTVKDGNFIGNLYTKIKN